MRWSYIISLIMVLLILLGCAQPEAGLPPIGQETRQIIEVRVVNQTVRYQCQSFWTEEEFSKILELRRKFEAEQITSFKENLGKYNKSASNTEIRIDEVNKSATLMCEVKGAMYSTNSYDFHWLLGDLPFDLYQFKQSKKKLNYEGEVNGVPTTIRLIFPYTIAHCREHVWPAK